MSKRFAFRLDAALKQRVRQEEAAQVVLAQAVQAHGVAVTEVTRSEQALHQERAGALARSGTLNTQARENLLYYLDRAERLIHQQRLVVQQRAQMCQRLQTVLLQASARRKALENLRERRLQEFQLEEQHRSDRALDEQATLRYMRPASFGREADAYSDQY